jgi:hypothetical protein
MSNQHQNTVNFYGSINDYVFSKPYAVLSADEVSRIVKRSSSWISTIETHPDLAEMLGEGKAAHIKMVTALPNAVKTAKQGGIFPNVILPLNEFEASMEFHEATQQPPAGDLSQLF